MMKRRVKSFLLLTAFVPWFSSCTQANIIRLQTPHPLLSPAESMSKIASECDELGAILPDVYGDFDKSPADSFLRQFEAEMAEEFGKEDAVFMPSGVMAQQIALLIHRNNNSNKKEFLCHATSHLLLHEQNGFRELCGLAEVVLPLHEPGTGLGAPPLLFRHVAETDLSQVSSLVLELPHRELGGKLTPWEDILQMQTHLQKHGIDFHCDGARIFEASSGYKKAVKELAKPFDSVYISFYKGLGSPLGGAMLLGKKEFCKEARIWLRRFGGNLYSLLPYIVAAKAGYLTYSGDPASHILSFDEKKAKLDRIMKELCSKGFDKVGRFEPTVPKVNMVHCYLRPSLETCNKLRDSIQEEQGVSIFHRISALNENDPGYQEGLRCKLEIYMGQANGMIEDEVWVRSWIEFCDGAAHLESLEQSLL
jgi:threonine aldolase